MIGPGSGAQIEHAAVRRFLCRIKCQVGQESDLRAGGNLPGAVSPFVIRLHLNRPIGRERTLLVTDALAVRRPEQGAIGARGSSLGNRSFLHAAYVCDAYLASILCQKSDARS